MKKNRAIFACFAALTAGCSTTLPLVVIGPGGETLKGTTTASMSGGSFRASNGVLTCAGNYNPWNLDITISAQVLCSDGRKGIVITTRERTTPAGHGTVRLNDGTEWTFIFGEGAENF